MVDFLAQAVIYAELIMIGDAQLVGHYLDRFKADCEDFGRGGLIVRVHRFGDNQQVNRSSRPVVGDNDYIIGFVEYLRGQFAIDHFGKYCIHAA